MIDVVAAYSGVRDARQCERATGAIACQTRTGEQRYRDHQAKERLPGHRVCDRERQGQIQKHGYAAEHGLHDHQGDGRERCVPDPHAPLGNPTPRREG